MNGYPIERIACIEEGAGDPPIVILHGWGGNKKTMAGLAKTLSVHRKVVSLDLPGFGDSPEPPEGWGTFEFVAALRRWLEVNHYSRCDFICHSFGGRVGIGLASRHPELVNRLTLIGSAGIKPRRSFQVRCRMFYSRQLRRVASLLGGKVARKIAEARQKLGSSDWQAASPVMRGVISRVLNEDLSTEMMKIKSPTLLIWGSKDTATPLWMGKTAALLIPGAEMLIIEGAGHFVFLEKSGEVLSAVWSHFALPKVW